MVNQIIQDNITHVSNVRFVLRGYWSGYDDNTYLVYSKEDDRAFDTAAVEYKTAFIARLRVFDFSEWSKCQVSCLVDPWRSPYWALEISFSNGYAPICFSSENYFPKNFQDFLALVGAGEEDDCYFDDYDEDDEIGDGEDV